LELELKEEFESIINKLVVLSMNVLRSVWYFLLVVSIGGYVSGCESSSEEKPIAGSGAYAMPFTLPKEFSAFKADIRRLDLNGDGFEDALVALSRADSSKLVRGFEQFVVFQYDSTKRTFAPAFRQHYFYGTSFDVRDVNGDGKREICVMVDGGGNSRIASQGMAVIGRDEQGNYREITALDEGAPELTRTGADSTNVILAYQSFEPQYIVQSDATGYIDSIVVFTTDAVQAAQIRRQVYEEYLLKAEKRYIEAKSTLTIRKTDSPASADVYAYAAAQMQYMKKLGLTKQCKAFRSREQAYWRQMLEDEYVQALTELAN